MNSPIDQLHADCIAARAAVRLWFREAQARARAWEPLPCPRRHTVLHVQHVQPPTRKKNRANH